jgi:hypothetical protein
MPLIWIATTSRATHAVAHAHELDLAPGNIKSVFDLLLDELRCTRFG